MTKRILVIDDEAAIQMVLQDCLEELAGWEVLLASSGREGLLVAQSERPDAILLDISMPGMDGVETYHELQAHEQTKPIPIVLLTAKVQPAERAQFAQLEIAGMIVKPFDPISLADRICEILHWNQEWEDEEMEEDENIELRQQEI